MKPEAFVDYPMPADEAGRYWRAAVVVPGGQGTVWAIRPSDHPDMFVLPGGHIDQGEHPEMAARREAIEEAGLTVEIQDHLGVLETPRSLTHVFLATTAMGPIGAQTPDEVSGRAMRVPISALVHTDQQHAFKGLQRHERAQHAALAKMSEREYVRHPAGSSQGGEFASHAGAGAGEDTIGYTSKGHPTRSRDAVVAKHGDMVAEIGKRAHEQTRGAKREFLGVAVTGVRPARDQGPFEEGEPLRTDLTKQETGKLADLIAEEFFQTQKGGASFRFLDTNQSNFPIDAVVDGEALEIKAGLVDNTKGAQQWRITKGEAGEVKKQIERHMSREQLAIYNSDVKKYLMLRKSQATKAVAKAMGRPLKPATLAMIINPDTRTVRVYKFAGHHERIGWKSRMARDGYVGTFRFGTRALQQESDPGFESLPDHEIRRLHEAIWREELHPRDAGGKFTDGGGVAATSPSVDESQDLATALERTLHGAEHARWKAEADAIDRHFKLKAATVNAVGDTTEWGSEDSFFTTYESGTFDDIAAAAIQKGLAMRQKAVLPFKLDDTGPDSMFTMDLPEERFTSPKVLQQLAKTLDAHGIAFRTFIPLPGGGTRIAIVSLSAFGAIDEDYQKVDKVSDALGVTAKQQTGHGEIIGADTRDEAAVVYRERLSRHRLAPAKLSEAIANVTQDMLRQGVSGYALIGGRMPGARTGKLSAVAPAREADFDETLHPRGERGRFVDKGGVGKGRGTALIAQAIEKFGVTKGVEGAGYILPDGRGLDMRSEESFGTPYENDPMHVNVHELYPDESFRERTVTTFLDDTGSIRWRHDAGGDVNVSTVHMPTRQQIELMVKTARKDRVDLVVDAQKIGKHWDRAAASEVFDRPTVDEVTKWFEQHVLTPSRESSGDWDETRHPRDEKGRFVAVPVDHDLGNRLEHESAAGGTQGAQWMRDPETGDRYVIKTYGGDADRVATEVLSAAVYRKLGVPVPEVTRSTRDGEPAAISKEITGAAPHETIKDSAALRAGFMADVLTANWDVVGLEFDNVIWKDGTPYRVDFGGSFTFRAQGAPKAFDTAPTEHETFVTKNPNTKRAFGQIPPADLKAQAAAIAKHLDDEWIDDAVEKAGFASDAIRNQVRSGLKRRRDWMAEYAGLAKRVREAADPDFEAKHPRGEGGKFIDKGGATATGEEEPKKKFGEYNVGDTVTAKLGDGEITGTIDHATDTEVDIKLGAHGNAGITTVPVGDIIAIGANAKPAPDGKVKGLDDQKTVEPAMGWIDTTGQFASDDQMLSSKEKLATGSIYLNRHGGVSADDEASIAFNPGKADLNLVHDLLFTHIPMTDHIRFTIYNDQGSMTATHVFDKPVGDKSTADQAIDFIKKMQAEPKQTLDLSYLLKPSTAGAFGADFGGAIKGLPGQNWQADVRQIQTGDATIIHNKHGDTFLLHDAVNLAFSDTDYSIMAFGLSKAGKGIVALKKSWADESEAPTFANLDDIVTAGKPSDVPTPAGATPPEKLATATAVKWNDADKTAKAWGWIDAKTGEFSEYTTLSDAAIRQKYSEGHILINRAPKHDENSASVLFHPGAANVDLVRNLIDKHITSDQFASLNLYTVTYNKGLSGADESKVDLVATGDDVGKKLDDIKANPPPAPTPLMPKGGTLTEMIDWMNKSGYVGKDLPTKFDLKQGTFATYGGSTVLLTAAFQGPDKDWKVIVKDNNSTKFWITDPGALGSTMPKKPYVHDEPDEDEEEDSVPDHWDALSSDQQEEAKQKWIDDNRQEFIDNEIESYKDNVVPDNVDQDMNDDDSMKTEMLRALLMKDTANLHVDPEDYQENFPADLIAEKDRLHLVQAITHMTVSKGKKSWGKHDQLAVTDDDAATIPFAGGPDPRQATIEGVTHEEMVKQYRIAQWHKIKDAVAKAYTDNWDKERDNRIENYEVTEDTVSDLVDDYMDSYWNEMSDDDKFQKAQDYNIFETKKKTGDKAGQVTYSGKTSLASREEPDVPVSDIPPPPHAINEDLVQRGKQSRSHMSLLEKVGEWLGPDSFLTKLARRGFTIKNDWDSWPDRPLAMAARAAAGVIFGGKVFTSRDDYKERYDEGKEGLREPDDAMNHALSHVKREHDSELAEPEFDKSFEAYVKAQYAMTQQHAADDLDEEITLYRGVGTHEIGEGPTLKLGQMVKFKPSSLASYSTSRQQGDNFGTITVKVTVPRHAVFSYHRTGPGTSSEREYLIVGDDYEFTGAVVRNNKLREADVPKKQDEDDEPDLQTPIDLGYIDTAENFEWLAIARRERKAKLKAALDKLRAKKKAKTIAQRTREAAATPAADPEFEEKHPRGEGGRFVDKGTGGAAPAAEAPTSERGRVNWEDDEHSTSAHGWIHPTTGEFLAGADLPSDVTRAQYKRGGILINRNPPGYETDGRSTRILFDPMKASPDAVRDLVNFHANGATSLYSVTYDDNHRASVNLVAEGLVASREYVTGMRERQERGPAEPVPGTEPWRGKLPKGFTPYGADAREGRAYRVPGHGVYAVGDRVDSYSPDNPRVEYRLPITNAEVLGFAHDHEGNPWAAIQAEGEEIRVVPGESLRLSPAPAPTPLPPPYRTTSEIQADEREDEDEEEEEEEEEEQEYVPESWEELSDDQREEAYDEWRRANYDSMVESEEEYYRSEVVPQNVDDDLDRDEDYQHGALVGILLGGSNDLRIDLDGERYADLDVEGLFGDDAAARTDLRAAVEALTIGKDLDLTDDEAATLPFAGGPDPRQATIEGITHDELVRQYRLTKWNAIKDAVARAYSDNWSLEREQRIEDYPIDVSDSVNENLRETWDSMRDRDRFEEARRYLDDLGGETSRGSRSRYRASSSSSTSREPEVKGEPITPDFKTKKGFAPTDETEIEKVEDLEGTNLVKRDGNAWTTTPTGERVRVLLKEHGSSIEDIVDAFTPRHPEIDLETTLQVTIEGGALVVRGSIQDDKSGKSVGDFTRHINLDEGYVKHDSFFIRREYQGGKDGPDYKLGGLFSVSTDKFYRALGLKKVKLDAVSNSGDKVTGHQMWPHQGYDWTNVDQAGGIRRAFTRAIEKRYGKDSPEHKSAKEMEDKGAAAFNYVRFVDAKGKKVGFELMHLSVLERESNAYVPGMVSMARSLKEDSATDRVWAQYAEGVTQKMHAKSNKKGT